MIMGLNKRANHERRRVSMKTIARKMWHKLVVYFGFR